ncbi:hypothetical protein ABZ642_09410 [Streptomyces sp. NPDC007157]|uniref:hypothetical protein n=1 Tax=Streptomyces sp. NPDC007157 TaxID=3154681 RepID=UPI0034102CCA
MSDGPWNIRRPGELVFRVADGSADDIDNGRRPGRISEESAELRAARRRIRELETELEIVRKAAEFLGEEKPAPKGSTRRSTVSSTPGHRSIDYD